MSDLTDRIKPLSPKARASINADGWMTVWEGSVRSGKTVASLVAWILYILKSPETEFVMSGNTFTSLVHNTIDGQFGLLNLFDPLIRMGRDSAGAYCLFIGDKTVYLFGAHDDSAYKRIKGLTVGGWYADEVATHPESFIYEAMARTIASSDRRMFWTLNPCVPSHYIYQSFLDRWEGTKGYRRYHFTLDDNLALTKERKEELARQYTGRFRDMFILGLRVAATGVIYDCFDRNKMVYDEIEDESDLSGTPRVIACDYGTVNPCVFLDCTFSHSGIVYVRREYRWDSRAKQIQKTDSAYVKDMIEFAGTPENCDSVIVVDPSAVSFITALQVEGFFVKPADNDVLKGIQSLSSLMAQNRLRIHSSCKGLISELEGYCWDEKSITSGNEKPLKVRDHAPDALRYYVNTCLTTYDILG